MGGGCAAKYQDKKYFRAYSRRHRIMSNGGNVCHDNIPIDIIRGTRNQMKTAAAVFSV